MTFYSLTFLLVFLPGGLLLFAATPRRWRYLTLLALSAAFYWALDARHLMLLAGCVVSDYLLALLVGRWEERRVLCGAALAVCVLKTLGIVFYYLMRARLEAVDVPAGLLVYALSSTGYVVDLYRGEAQTERNLPRFFVYCCFFGRVLMGPYARYNVIRPQLKRGEVSLVSISTGMTLIIQGVAKKVVLADSLLEVYHQINAFERRDMTLLSAWMLVLFFALGVYFSLGSLCDIARGLGQLFSFKLPRNVYYPLHANSIREFAVRFNTTLFGYLRRYVYRPLGGAGYGVLSDSCNTILYMMLFGAWFGMTPNCVLWGAFLAVWMLGEKYVFGRLLKRLPLLLARLYSWLVMLLSFCLLSQNTLDSSLFLARTLFTFQRGMAARGMVSNDQIVYILSQGYWALILGALFSVPLLPKLTGTLKKHLPGVSNLVMLVLYGGLLAVSIMFMV